MNTQNEKDLSDIEEEQQTAQRRTEAITLSAKLIDNLAPKAKQYGIADRDGLTLIVKPTGGKMWWFRYRFAGKSKTLSLGCYPEVSLKSARDRTIEARRLVAEGIDPSAIKKEKKQELQQAQAEVKKDIASQFETVGREWFEKFRVSQKWADNHASKILGRLENDIFPYIGKRSVAEIEPPELLEVIRRIENRGALETAHRALAECRRIFCYAIASGLAKYDPSASLKNSIPPYRKDNHFAAITNPKEVGDLLRDIDGYTGSVVVRIAFALSPYVFLRPGELRRLQWTWIDFEQAKITIPADFHKTGKRTQEPHVVPMSLQVIKLIREIQPLTGNGLYVFPGERDKNRPMSDNAIRSALRRLGWANDEMTPHGFRALASTILDNKGYRPEWIERQLAHDESNKVKAAYKRDLYMMYMPERKQMMQEWADYLDSLRNGAEIVPLKAA